MTIKCLIRNIHRYSRTERGMKFEAATPEEKSIFLSVGYIMITDVLIIYEVEALVCDQ